MQKIRLAEKGKYDKIIKHFKFNFQKKLSFNKIRWNCTTKIYKMVLKVDENDKVKFNESELNHYNWIHNNP